MGRIRLFFDFDWHLAKKDARGIGERIGRFRPHIYFLEEYGLPTPTTAAVPWLSGSGVCYPFLDHVVRFNALIRGAREGDALAIQQLRALCGVGERQNDRFQLAHIDAIVGSRNLKIYFLETHGKAEEIATDLRRLDEASRSAFYHMVTGPDFETAVRLFRPYLIKNARLLETREQNIIDNIRSLRRHLRIVAGEFASIAAGEEIGAYIRYGITHTPVYDKLVGLLPVHGKYRGDFYELSMRYNPEEDSTENRILSRLRQDLDAPISDHLILFALAENLLTSFYFSAAANRGLEPALSTGEAYKKARGFMQAEGMDGLREVTQEANKDRAHPPVVALSKIFGDEGCTSP